ncbi:hypothetical protein [Celerinatantimonas sp. YJH-8]|uniref:hypothetical protein n=1 Tax=Celerinatantimonas sp. YJH-8 TaxID=3228714 RepID=UPI0038C9C5EA
MKKVVVRIICCWFLMAISSISYAAIVNNNHLYQQSEIIIQQLQSIRQAKALASLTPEPPIVAGKLATSLFFKANDLVRLAGQLQQAQGLTVISPIEPEFRVFRPSNIMAPLQILSKQLEEVRQQLGILSPLPEIDVPMGKSVNDVYRQLLIIEALFNGLTKESHFHQIEMNIALSKQALQWIAEHKQRSISFPSIQAVQGREATDDNLLAYQILYLTGQLFRQIGVDTTEPGRFPIGESTLSQVEDTLLNLRAELHRGQTVMGASVVIPTSFQSSGQLDTNLIYAQLTQLRDGLLGMLAGGHDAR